MKANVVAANRAQCLRVGGERQRGARDVDVEEQPTGTLSFGASYGVANGFGLT